MKTVLMALFLSLGGIALAQEPTSGVRPLFDGKTLTGWVQRGGKASYRVEDGCIVGRTVLNTSNSFLCTERDYRDFVLELEFKVDPQLNSGVQIRSECFDTTRTNTYGGKPIKIPAGRVHGYQIEIDPSKRAWTGGIYDEGRRGWLSNLEKNAEAQGAFKQGEWNLFRIEAKGSSIKTWVNDVPAADLKDDVTPKGLIALQVHSSKQEGLEIRWRNIRIRELAAP